MRCDSSESGVDHIVLFRVSLIKGNIETKQIWVDVGQFHSRLFAFPTPENTLEVYLFEQRDSNQIAVRTFKTNPQFTEPVGLAEIGNLFEHLRTNEKVYGQKLAKKDAETGNTRL